MPDLSKSSADGRSQSGDYRHQLSLPYTRSMRAFSTFSILPQSDGSPDSGSAFLGRTARRVTLDDVYSSVPSVDFSWQSAAARWDALSMAGLACGVSRLFAPAHGQPVRNALMKMARATSVGFSSKYHQRPSFPQRGLTARLPRRPLVPTLELHSVSLTETIVDPPVNWLSSPSSFCPSLIVRTSLPYSLMTLVRAFLKPVRGYRRRGMDIDIGKRQDQIIAVVVLLQATSAKESCRKQITSSDSASSPRLFCNTPRTGGYRLIVENLSAWLGLAALVGKTMRMPAFRNACSRAFRRTS